MNLRKPILFLLLLFLFFKQGFLLSQSDTSGRRSVWLMINAAMIANDSYSHFKESQSSDHFSSSNLSPIPYGPHNSLGYNVGAYAIFGTSNEVKFVCGLSISSTGAKYLYHSSSTDPNNGSISKARIIDETITSRYAFFNFENGIKIHTYEHFSFMPSFVLNLFPFVRQEISGTQTDIEIGTFPNLPGAPQSYSIQSVQEFNTTQSFRDDSQASLRLTVYYEFKLKTINYNAFIFRNIGIGFKLPWWGFGASVIL